MSVTHFIGLSDGLLEGKYRLVRAPVDNTSTAVKLFIVEQRSAWGTITPMKQKDEEQLQREEEHMSPDIQFGRPGHRADMEEVERRLRDQHALVADIKSKRQTDDDKTG